jgi:hypothetical protein
VDLYSYVLNNPLSNVDTDGHACSGVLGNTGSGFCTRATEYGQIDANAAVQSQTRFFAAANAVSQALADVATPVSGFVVSGQTANFLEGVGQNLEKLNQSEVSAIQNGSLSGPWKGQGWWSYSAVAVALFLVHSQIFFAVSGGSTRSEKLGWCLHRVRLHLCRYTGLTEVGSGTSGLEQIRVRTQQPAEVHRSKRALFKTGQKESETGICIEAFIAKSWFRLVGRGDDRTFSGTDSSQTARSRIKLTVDGKGNVTSQEVARGAVLLSMASVCAVIQLPRSSRRQTAMAPYRCTSHFGVGTEKPSPHRLHRVASSKVISTSTSQKGEPSLS